MSDNDLCCNEKIWRWQHVFFPLIILISITIFFREANLDLFITSLFYNKKHHFYLQNMQPWMFLYKNGNIPSIAIGVFGLGLLISEIIRQRWRQCSKICLFLVLMLVIGPGIIVNTVFKANWGRPRPREIIEYSGSETYLPVWEKGVSGIGQSFPSGHAAIGYYLMAPFFVFYAMGKKRQAYFFLWGGLIYGTLMGLGRVIQGAHFASDVLWSAGFVYYTGLSLAMALRLDNNVSTAPSPPPMPTVQADFQTWTG